MAQVVALYRFPVKGFGPERRESLTILEGGGVAGDRVLAFRFANASAVDDAWGTKHECVALVNTPGLAKVGLHLDGNVLRLSIGGKRVEERIDTGRERLAAALQDYVLGLQENPLKDHPERLPIKLVGDGVTPRYRDAAADLVTLHSRESLAAVSRAAKAEVDEVRFRSNVAAEGFEAWEEQGWAGRRIRIGALEFSFVRRKGRCLATHANPDTGERDLPLMKVLPGLYPEPKPTFAVALATTGKGGDVRVGDEIAVTQAP